MRIAGDRDARLAFPEDARPVASPDPVLLLPRLLPARPLARPRHALAFALSAALLVLLLATPPAFAANAAPGPLGSSLDARSAHALLDAADRLRDGGRPADALVLQQRVLSHDTGDAGVAERAFRSRAMSLADLGSAGLAYAALQERPALFPAHERERIEGDRVARMIAWGATMPETPDTRQAEARAALATLRELQAVSPRTTNWEATRLRVDALAALNRLQRHQEVADGHAALLADGIEVPGYILATVGDSLLALRRAEDATVVLQQALTHDPEDFNAGLLLAYAWLEQERFDLALPQFASLADQQVPWPRRAGARSGYQNWDRYTGDINRAIAQSFANDNGGAEASLAALGGIGPYNAGTQSAIGSVQLRRLRPAAALERFDMALTLDPDTRDARVGRVDALLALDLVDEARAAYAELRRRHPADPRLDRLGRRLERHRGWQVAVDANRGRSRARDAGTSLSPLGSRDGSVRVAIDSPLIDDRWRIGAVAEEAWADFDDQRIRFRRAGLGASYRHDRLGVSAIAARAVDDFGDGGISLTVAADWRFSDAWHGSLQVARRDIDASLQARRFGITADSVAAAALWTPSDETWLRVGASQFRYDDGNRRQQVGFDASQRLYRSPHWLVDGLAGVSTSRGSRGADVPYFNPERDASASIGARIDHLAWRRYERHFRHRLDVTVGPYHQRGFGTAWMPAVGYRHLLQFDGGHVLEYGVAWSRPVYDGNREQRVGIDLVYRWGDAR